MIKLYPRKKPYYNIDDWISLINILKKKPVEEFEKKFAEKFENKYGIMFQYGRTALYGLFKVWNLENSEIICPAFTCTSVPTAIVYSGNIPVFVDIKKGSCNMDIEKIKNNITKNTKAIIVTHLFGFPMDIVKIENIVKNAEDKFGHKIYIIQDVAQCFGAKWKGKIITNYGDVSIFGLGLSKIITSIFGGMATTNSNIIYQKLKEWREKNIKKRATSSIIHFFYFLFINTILNPYFYAIIDYLSGGKLNKSTKMDKDYIIHFPKDWDIFPTNIEARIGLSQLKKYDYIVENKIKNAKKWMNKLKDEKIIFLDEDNGCTFSHCVALVEKREEILKRFKDLSYELGFFDNYAIPYLNAFKKYKKEEFINLLEFYKKAVNFPNWIGIKI